MLTHILAAAFLAEVARCLPAASIAMLALQFTAATNSPMGDTATAPIPYLAASSVSASICEASTYQSSEAKSTDLGMGLSH